MIVTECGEEWAVPASGRGGGSAGGGGCGLFAALDQLWETGLSVLWHRNASPGPATAFVACSGFVACLLSGACHQQSINKVEL